MHKLLNDPLLAAGRIIVMLGQAIMVVASAALIVALPIVLFGRDFIEREIREDGKLADVVFPYMQVAGVMFVALLVVLLAFLFLKRLQRIIDTVGEGDPFVPENAQRLTIMAWLMLGIQVLSFAIVPLVISIETALRETNPGAGDNVDFSGIVLVVVLFILARVFRKGTEMREDLEGTV